MRNLLLIENNETHPFPANELLSNDYCVRKITDIYSLTLHFKEFNPDIIVLNLTITDLILTELNNLSPQSVPVVIYTEECSINLINQLINAEVSFLSINGFSCSLINNHIDIAFARFNHLQKLKTALEDARTQLEDRKQIDRAKAILIKTRNFSEDEAYHTLRKLAMGRNITLGEMARNVIAMADLLK